MRARDTFEFHTISEGRKAHYLSNETATYTGSGEEEVKRNNMEDKGKQTREQNCISRRLIERQHKEESQIG